MIKIFGRVLTFHVIVKSRNSDSGYRPLTSCSEEEPRKKPIMQEYQYIEKTKLYCNNPTNTKKAKNSTYITTKQVYTKCLGYRSDQLLRTAE